MKAPAEKPASNARDTERGAKLPVVVVELFSSEGCSSCPPADTALEALSRPNAIDGVEVIPLEQHVDYWNDLGWRDPFSDAKFSQRQRGYANAGARNGVFTPEAIIDGTTSLVGSNLPAMRAAIRGAAERTHVAVDVEKSDGSTVAVTVGDLPRADDDPAATWIAVTEAGLETSVQAGENRGETLRHAPVVRALERLGAAKTGKMIYPLPAFESAHAGAISAVVFVQHDGDRSILGAARVVL